MILHLALEIDGFIVIAPAQRGSTHSTDILVQVDKEGDRNMEPDATLLSSFPWVISIDRPVESNG